MSGSQQFTKQLRAGISPGTVGASVTALKTWMAELNDTDDLVDAMQDAARVVLAAEALAEAAGSIEKAARVSLAEVMSESGCSSIDIGTHTISVRDATRSAIITDPKAIPDEFIRVPEPAPDKTKIAKALRDGRAVPGAELTNGGAPIVTFRGKES